MLGLVLFALLVRLLGIRMGLPFFHHWDEVYIAGSARQMIAAGNDIPTTYVYGAPLMRLTVFGYHLAQALNLPVIRLNDEVALRWISRAIATLISTSAVFAAYLAARWSFRRGPAALAAALLFAVAAELVWHARYGVTDAGVAALTMWTLAATAAYLRHRSLATALLALLAAGLAFAFKINGLLALVLPAGALLARSPLRLVGSIEIGKVGWRRALSRATLVAAVPLVFVVFFFFNPHFIDRWSQALANLTAELVDHYRVRGHIPPYHYREAGLPHLGAALHYLAFQSLHTQWLASGLMALFAVLGIALAAVRGNLLVVLGAAHAALLVLSIAWPNRAYLARMYLGALPVLCLGFGFAWDRLGAWARGRGLPVRLAALLATALLLVAPVHEAVMAARLRVDARARALDFIAAQARQRGPVTVAATPTVAGAGAIGVHPGIRSELSREGVRFLPEVPSAAAAAASGADYLVVASHYVIVRGQPYQELWPFQSVPGYRTVASFPYSRYEHRLEIAPWWDGRVATVVLARAPQ